MPYPGFVTAPPGSEFIVPLFLQGLEELVAFCPRGNRVCFDAALAGRSHDRVTHFLFFSDPFRVHVLRVSPAGGEFRLLVLAGSSFKTRGIGTSSAGGHPPVCVWSPKITLGVPQCRDGYSHPPNLYRTCTREDLNLHSPPGLHGPQPCASAVPPRAPLQVVEDNSQAVHQLGGQVEDTGDYVTHLLRLLH